MFGLKIMTEKSYKIEQDDNNLTLRIRDNRIEKMEKQYASELEFLKADMERVFTTITKIRIDEERSKSCGRFRLTLDIDDRMIEEVFQHGNDSKLIEWFGYSIGRQAQAEIFAINTTRTARREG